MVLTICIFSKCSSCDIKPPSPYSSIKIISPAVYQLNENGTEVDIKLDIHSFVEDDAYLVLRVEKLCHQYSSNTPSIYEGFKDSLKIEGFHVRSYSTLYNYNGITDTDGSIVDFPMYIKKTSIRKGNNKEEFKIVLPRTLSSINAQVRVLIGIVRFNAEIKNNFENFPDKYKWSVTTQCDHGNFDSYPKFYFENFPDSSKTSFVFSNFYILESMSWMSGNEIPTLYEKCGFPAKEYTFSFTEYPNWGLICFWIEPYI